MTRIFALVFIIFASFIVAPIPAQAAGVDCIAFGYPSVSSSATAIRVSVTADSRCKTPFGISSGGGLYTITGESYSSSSCSGPYDFSNFGGGTITCTITLGGSLGSSRAYATSSTIHIWFAYDSSTKDITFSHPSIPPKTYGGSSGGGGTSGGATSAPVSPNCTAAPDVPNLSIEWNSTGPKFEYSPSVTGNKATALFWSFSLWNDTTNTWEGWATWKTAPAITGIYQASAIEGKTKIAFAVQAANACGASAQAREVKENTGVALAPLEYDQITLVNPLPSSIKAGATALLYGVAKSKLGLILDSVSLTPNVCSTDGTSTIKLLVAGTCKLSVSSEVFQNKMGATSVPIEFAVLSPKRSQTILTDFVEKYYLPGTLYVADSNQKSAPNSIFAYADSNLPLIFESASESVCNFSIPNWLHLNQSGTCVLRISQKGNNDFQAEYKMIQFEVSSEIDPAVTAILNSAKKKTTVNCVKGKVTKKVTGINPKCPAGYKLRK